MKKFLVVLALSMGMKAGYGQVLISLVFGDKLNSGKIEFGLDGGLSLSTLSGAPGAQNVSGFNLGFYFDIKTKNPAWMVSTGVVVKGPMGAKGLPIYPLSDESLNEAFNGGKVTTQLGYFYVPICMKYTIKERFFLKGGIQLGLINKTKDEFVKTIADEDDLTYTLNRKGDYHPIDGGLACGIGYRLMKGYGMNLGINYYHGLIDAEVDDTGADLFNRAFYINVGIPIGKGKAEKKQKAKEQASQ